MNVILCHLPPPLLNQLAVVRPVIGQGSPCALRAVTPCHLTPITYLHHFANCPQYRFQWVGFWCREPWWHQLPWWKLPHCSPQLLVEAPPAAASSRCHRSAGWSCCFSTAVTPTAPLPASQRPLVHHVSAPGRIAPATKWCTVLLTTGVYQQKCGDWDRQKKLLVITTQSLYLSAQIGARLAPEIDSIPVSVFSNIKKKLEGLISSPVQNWLHYFSFV